MNKKNCQHDNIKEKNNFNDDDDTEESSEEMKTGKNLNGAKDKLNNNYLRTTKKMMMIAQDVVEFDSTNN